VTAAPRPALSLMKSRRFMMVLPLNCLFGGPLLAAAASV
jgi:hypothetical protein